jgi:hypothetical protein
MATDLKAAGATPVDLSANISTCNAKSDRYIMQIIVSPLSRRIWDDGEFVDYFVDWRVSALGAAGDAEVEYLDLNNASTTYIKAIGEENSMYYNDAEGDSTHLNSARSKVFGRMVADLLLSKRSDLETYIGPNEALSDLIWSWQFATGDE